MQDVGRPVRLRLRHPDPDCQGQGCSEAGCRMPKCQTRHGCDPGVNTDPTTTARASIRRFSPATTGPARGITTAQATAATAAVARSTRTAMGSVARRRAATTSSMRQLLRPRRPALFVRCGASRLGRRHRRGDAEQGSLACNSLHFDANDGCDCGCGGIDPDCGTRRLRRRPAATTTRATAAPIWTRSRPIGCAPPEWLTAGCDAEALRHRRRLRLRLRLEGPGLRQQLLHDRGLPGRRRLRRVLGQRQRRQRDRDPVACPGWTCRGCPSSTSVVCDCGCGTLDPYAAAKPIA